MLDINPSSIQSGDATSGKRYSGADSATSAILIIVITAIVTGVVLGSVWLYGQIKTWRQTK